MSTKRFVLTRLAIAALCILAIALSAKLLPEEWSSGYSVLLGVAVGYWAFQQIDQFRWLQWFLSKPIVPLSELPSLWYPFDMKY